MHRTSSPGPVPEPVMPVDEIAHDAYEEYALEDEGEEEPQVPTDTDGEDRYGAMPRRVHPAAWICRLYSNVSRNLSGENVSAQRNLGPTRRA